MKKTLICIAVLSAVVGQSFAAESDNLQWTGDQNDIYVTDKDGDRVLVGKNRQVVSIGGLADQSFENTKNIKANADAIDKVQSQADANSEALKTHNANIAQNIEDIKKNADAIGALEKKDELIKEHVMANADAIDKVQSQADANSAAVEGAQQDASQALRNASAAYTAANAAQVQANQNTEDINKNTADIAKHYKEMKNNFAAVNSRIDNLDDEMKKGFAANAAIAGLFQPYNVGKFNVTAALGGYDSEQAIAIGSGFRFNESFAVKAAVATNTSDFDAVTYNVGVNFEW